MTRVVCIGECMVELRRAGEETLTQGFAGDAYNTAVYLKRAAPEAGVQFVTCLGQDRFSLDMRKAWRAEGIDDDLAFVRPDKQPGLYLIETDGEGERRFRYWRGDSAARGWLRAVLAHGGPAMLAGADLIYLSGISLAILSDEDRAAALILMAELSGRVGVLAFDPNYRPVLWSSAQTARETLEAAMQIADIALPSTEDLQGLFGLSDPATQMDRLIRAGAREIALTTEPGRCLIRAGAVREVEGPWATRVVDTSGAGDSFNGAYLAARLGGASSDAAARAGLALAAQVVGRPGAILPNVQEFEGR